MLACIYQTRMLPGGTFHVWLIFLCSWGCDTCAYCAGMLFGKHKMAPVLSPKKSVEGAVGGVTGSVILGLLYALITRGPLLQYAVICGIGALISMVGDLAASAIKRNMEIKDYGKLIPGHGGIQMCIRDRSWTGSALPGRTWERGIRIRHPMNII